MEGENKAVHLCLTRRGREPFRGCDPFPTACRKPSQCYPSSVNKVGFTGPCPWCRGGGGSSIFSCLSCLDHLGRGRAEGVGFNTKKTLNMLIKGHWVHALLRYLHLIIFCTKGNTGMTVIRIAGTHQMAYCTG